MPYTGALGGGSRVYRTPVRSLRGHGGLSYQMHYRAKGLGAGPMLKCTWRPPARSQRAYSHHSFSGNVKTCNTSSIPSYSHCERLSYLIRLTNSPSPYLPPSRHAHVRAKGASGSSNRFHAIYRTMKSNSTASLSNHRNCQITSTSTQDRTAASPLLAAMPREAS
jgi:hypothetical protein